MPTAKELPNVHERIYGSVFDFLNEIQKDDTWLSKALILGDTAKIEALCHGPWEFVDGKAGAAFCKGRAGSEASGCYDADTGKMYVSFDLRNMSPDDVKTFLRETTRGKEHIGDYLENEYADDDHWAKRNIAYLDRFWMVQSAIRKAEHRVKNAQQNYAALDYIEALCDLMAAVEDFERAEYGHVIPNDPLGFDTMPPVQIHLEDWFGFETSFYRLLDCYKTAPPPFSVIGHNHVDLRGVGRFLSLGLKEYRKKLTDDWEAVVEANRPDMTPEQLIEEFGDSPPTFFIELLRYAIQEFVMALGEGAAALLFPDSNLPDVTPGQGT